MLNCRFVLVFCATWVLCPDSRARADADSSDKVYQRLLRSVAWVWVNKDHGPALGTGFVVDRNRKRLVTNYHVVDTNHRIVENAANVFVYFPLFRGGRSVADRKQYIRYDRPVRGKVLAVDARRDLAVIELELVIPEALELSLAAASARRGEKVYMIGNPGASEFLWETNFAVVEEVGRKQITDQLTRRQIDVTVVEMKTLQPALPGYSGGPVVNEYGKLVAVTTRSNVRQHLATGIDVSEVRDVLGLVKAYPRDSRVLDPQGAGDYQSRGLYYLGRGREDSAIVDFSEALRIDPKSVSAFRLRGITYGRKGQYKHATADLQEALRLDPQDARTCQELAWLKAVCPEARQRDGKMAVELATKACELSAWKDARCLDTLAAAYAEDGQFQQAVQWEMKALELAHEHDKAPFQARRELYDNGKPYRGKLP
jgi:tetratricopeptide (TPR) repeat protein